MDQLEFIRQMPKVELHVHLEGSVRPTTLLKLAAQHGVELPATTVEGLQEWYKFTDFSHFAKVYNTISKCIRTPDDIELITREFLSGQAEQNILYSEVTYTARTHLAQKGLSFEEQLAAIERARVWAKAALGVEMGVIIDIARTDTPQEGLLVAHEAVAGRRYGVVALGLGGAEVGNPPERFVEAFDYAFAQGLPAIPHAGETVGPVSIWGALRSLHAVRIGHGVRCLEDPALVAYLRERQIPLEVCPTSNVCLGVASSLSEHPLPRLLQEGLYVTLNSDDPPMFNTTLTDEYLAVARVFDLDLPALQKLVWNGFQAALLSGETREGVEKRIKDGFARLGLPI